jgi:cytochrome P450
MSASELTQEALGFFADPAQRRDPYALLAQLQREAPIFQSFGGTWITTRYSEASTILTDPSLSIDLARCRIPLPLAQSPTIAASVARMMSMRDPPDHDRLHRLVAPFFTRRTASTLRSRIDDIVLEMIQPGIESGRLDIVQELGEDLPVAVTCTLLEIPREDWPAVYRWAESLTGQVMRLGQSPSELAAAERSRK